MRLACVLLALVAAVTAQRTWRIERHRLATILFGVSFVDQNFGYVSGAVDGAGAAILQTRDGGSTYQRVPYQGQVALGMFLTIQAPSRSSAAAGGLCGFCFEASGIEYTQNGNEFQLADDPSPIFPPLVGLQGSSAVRGATVPTYAFVGQFGDGYGVSYSLDNGLTWARAEIDYPQARARYIAMASATTWYVTCGSWPRNGKDDLPGVQQITEALSFHSNNASVTGIKAVFDFDVLSSSPSRHLLQAPDRYRTAILKTTDAGRTFTPVFERLTNDYYLNNLDCLNELTCFVSGQGDRGVTLHTSDGGRTWNEVLNIPGRNIQVMDVRFLNVREGFVAAAQLAQNDFMGIMYHTVDGGNTFTRSEIPNVAPVSLSLYTAQGSLGGHGTALTADGSSSTIVYN